MRYKNYDYDLGSTTEAIVLSAYLRSGFQVSVPFSKLAAYDLIVDTGKRLLKVQAKTAWIRAGCMNYHSRRRVGGSYNDRRAYEDGEIDYFAVYCPQTNSLFVIPAEGHGKAGMLRIEPTKNNQKKMVKWAKDFSWDKHIEELKVQ
jgi:hypothetical protein